MRGRKEREENVKHSAQVYGLAPRPKHRSRSLPHLLALLARLLSRLRLGLGRGSRRGCLTLDLCLLGELLALVLAQTVDGRVGGSGGLGGGGLDLVGLALLVGHGGGGLGSLDLGLGGLGGESLGRDILLVKLLKGAIGVRKVSSQSWK
jgi:hypothetical protein